MALAVTARFDFVDAKGARSSTKVRIPTGLTVAAMISFVQGMAQLLANMTTGRINRAGFCVRLDLGTATIKASPDLLSDIAQKGHFGFSTDESGFFTRMKVPAIDELKIVAGTDQIDQADLDIAAFITAMEDGLSGVSPTDSRENDVTTTDFARELFRKK